MCKKDEWAVGGEVIEDVDSTIEDHEESTQEALKEIRS